MTAEQLPYPTHCPFCGYILNWVIINYDDLPCQNMACFDMYHTYFGGSESEGITYWNWSIQIHLNGIRYIWFSDHFFVANGRKQDFFPPINIDSLKKLINFL